MQKIYFKNISLSLLIFVISIEIAKTKTSLFKIIDKIWQNSYFYSN